MKSYLKLLLLSVCLLFSCEKKGDDASPKESFDGLVINEVSPSKIIGAEGWFELYNKSERSINLSGLKVMLMSDGDAERTQVAVLQEGSVAAKSWYVVDAALLSKDMLRATFAELTICDSDGLDVNSFNVKYDYGLAKKPEDGGSWSKIPDGTGSWTVTGTASPGAANYVITPYNITDIVINEVCPSEKWVEIVNASTSYQNLEYSCLKTKAGLLVHRVPAGFKLGPGERFVVECGDAGLDELEYYANTGKLVTSFSSAGLPASPAGTSWSVLPDTEGAMALSTVVTKNAVNRDETEDESAIVLNEISSPESWVEVFNPSDRDIRISSMMLYGKSAAGQETALVNLGSCLIAAHSAKVVTADVPAYKAFVLKSKDGALVDSLSVSEVDDGGSAEKGTSWSRLPNGSGKWYTVKTPTKGEANYGIAKGNTRAVWAFSSSMSTEMLDEMCKAGIGHILVNEYALESGKTTAFKEFVSEAEARGQKVHVWVQCFYHGGEWTPATVADEKDSKGYMIKGHMNQDAFDEIISRAKGYMAAKPYGIHFDYIRFGGSGAKYNGGGLTPYDSITEFTRQISEALREIDPGIVLSAALMGEKGNPLAYGQNCGRMSEYLDIIFPMAYISSYHYSYMANANVATWFAENVRTGTQVWHGFSTYSSAGVGLTAAEMHKDVAYISENCPKVSGMAMFRYGIGKFADFSDLFVR